MDESSSMDSTAQELNDAQNSMASLEIVNDLDSNINLNQQESSDEDNGNQNIENDQLSDEDESDSMWDSDDSSGQSGDSSSDQLPSLPQPPFSEEDKRKQAQDFKDRLTNNVLKKNLLCIICKDIIIKATITNCSHTFCEFCIQTWLTKYKKCPICETQIIDTIRTESIDSFTFDLCNFIGGTVKEQRDISLIERAHIETIYRRERSAEQGVPEDNNI